MATFRECACVTLRLWRNVPAMRDSETLLTTREVADELGVTPQTVAKWVFAGRLTPALRGPGLRGSMFFDPSDIDALRRSA